MQKDLAKAKASVREVINAIKGQIDQEEIEAAINDALKIQFERAQAYQAKQGVKFDLTFEQFLTLVSKSRRRKMAQKIQTGNFEAFMKSDSGYVLGWKNRAAFKSQIMNIDTAAYINRADSKRNCQFSNGDTHTEEAKAKISAKRRGQKHSDETKAKISKSKQNVSDETRNAISQKLKGKPKSDEQKAKMRAAALARQARIRAEKREQETTCHEPIQQKQNLKSPKPVEAKATQKKPDARSVTPSEAKSLHPSIVKILQRLRVKDGAGIEMKANERVLDVHA